MVGGRGLEGPRVRGRSGPRVRGRSGPRGRGRGGPRPLLGERLRVGLNACATSRLRVKVRVGEGSAPRARLRAPLPPRPGRHARPWRGRRRRPAWREAGVSASSAGALGCIGVHCGDGNNLLLECYARPPLRCQAQEWTAALR